MLTAKHELTASSQFHQHFTHAFFAQKRIEQLSIAKFQLSYFWRQNFSAKCAHKMLMKLTQALRIEAVYIQAILKMLITSRKFESFKILTEFFLWLNSTKSQT